MSALPDLFVGFAERRIKTVGDVEIYLRTGGSGPPLLLLHGYPQTHVMWHKIAPELARHCTLVIPDLRGYGTSSAPPGDEAHTTYSKRAMGEDCLAVMRALGHERFMVAGHDRGGRVAYRMALDHPARVNRLAVLDIEPTYEQFARGDRHSAKAGFHWYFLAQPRGFPERLIGGDPEFFLRHMLGNPPPAGRATHFSDMAFAEYLRCFCDPEVIWATDVRGRGLPCGHFLPEEAPDDTLAELTKFFQGT